MLVEFFFALKDARIPVSIREFLVLLEALRDNLIPPSVDDFYYLARTALVKNECHYDKFDKAFAHFFHGVGKRFASDPELPAEWLQARIRRELTDEQRAALEKLGRDKLMERLAELLQTQQERHEGGGKWIGTGGSSPFGNGGENPEGIRMGGKSEQRIAIKVWDQRAYRDYDDSRELGTRNIKLALRRLRRFARDGAQEEFAFDETIKATAENAGYLDIRLRPARRNNIKVLMLLDVGGTMDDHIARTEELFSAAKAEFKQMEFFYFHNCVYDQLWKSNWRRHAERFSTWDVLRKHTPDTKLIFVGDATMSPYEVLQPGGSIEYPNEEAGAAWLQRLTHAFPKFAWLNPEPEGIWQYRQSVAVIRDIMQHRMFPVTLQGLERAMRALGK